MAYNLYIKLYKYRWVDIALAGDCVQVLCKIVEYYYKYY